MDEPLELVADKDVCPLALFPVEHLHPRLAVDVIDVGNPAASAYCDVAAVG